MSKNTDKKLDELIAIIERTSRVAPIAPVAPVAPIAPIAPVVQPNFQDHDTLTGLVGQVREIDKKLTEVSGKLDSKYTTKEEYNDVVKKQEDHEKRIRLGEQIDSRIIGWGSAALVFLAIIEFVINKFL